MRFFFFAASFSQITTAHHVVIRLWAQTQKQRHLSCFDITKKLPRRAPRQFLCASRRIDTPPGAAAAYPCPAPAKPLGWCQIYRRVDRDRPRGELLPAVSAAVRKKLQKLYIAVVTTFTKLRYSMQCVRNKSKKEFV